MNLFFRLLMVFLKASFSKKDTGIFETTTIRSRVMLTDQDMFAHMTNSRYFSFGDLATINFIIRTNCWSGLRKRGWAPAIASESIIFTRMLRAHQAFRIETRLIGWDETYICLEHRFIRGEQQTAALRTVARFASRNKSERVGMKDVSELLELDEVSPALPEEFKRMIADVKAARVSA